MMNSDFAARITLDEWQEYQNLKANFHRYTDCYVQEQQTLLARIDHLQIENAALHEKLLTQKQYCYVKTDDPDVQRESIARRLSRRASLFDGTWTNSLQSTMVSPYPPTIFSPSVSISRARKPNLAVTVPDRMPPPLSLSSDGQSKSSFNPPSSWTWSPLSLVSQKQEGRCGNHLPAIDSPAALHSAASVEDESFSHANWANIDFNDDDAPPPGTAVSAPADLITGSRIGSARYTMILIDASNVTFPVELVVQGKRGGHAFVDNLHHTIVGQLAKHELAPITDTFMIRMVMLHGEYGNVKEGSVNLEPMEEFCLGMQSHMSSMPFEVIPNLRFNELPSALLSALRMCLSDGDCQRVFLAVDTSLPVYYDALVKLSATFDKSKLLLLNGDIDTQNMGLTCLDVRDIMSLTVKTSGSAVPLSTTLTCAGTDEAKWIPPTYSTVAKAESHSDLLRDDSATPSARDSRNATTETWHSSSLPQAVTVPHLPIVHVISEFRGIQAIKRQYGQHPCARFHLEGICQQRDEQNCAHLHEEIEFTKRALDRYRRYVYSQPCPRGVACSPDTVQTCKLRHTCPWGGGCAFTTSKRCLFDGYQFQGKGHQPNTASMLYGERIFKEEYAVERRLVDEGFDERVANKVANIHAPSISSGEDKEPNLTPQDFQPMLIVLRSMNQTNMKSRQLRARVNELIQARFPGIYPRLGLVNFKSYSAKAEAAKLVEMGRCGEGRDWIALTEKGKQLLTKK